MLPTPVQFLARKPGKSPLKKEIKLQRKLNICLHTCDKRKKKPSLIVKKFTTWTENCPLVFGPYPAVLRAATWLDEGSPSAGCPDQTQPLWDRQVLYGCASLWLHNKKNKREWVWGPDSASPQASVCRSRPHSMLLSLHSTDPGSLLKCRFWSNRPGQESLQF